MLSIADGEPGNIRRSPKWGGPTPTTAGNRREDGLHAVDASNPAQFTFVSKLSSVEITAELSTANGVTYEIQSSGDLLTWAAERTIVGNGSTVSVPLRSSAGDPARFFRAVVR